MHDIFGPFTLGVWRGLDWDFPMLLKSGQMQEPSVSLFPQDIGFSLTGVNHILDYVWMF